MIHADLVKEVNRLQKQLNDQLQLSSSQELKQKVSAAKERNVKEKLLEVENNFRIKSKNHQKLKQDYVELREINQNLSKRLQVLLNQENSRQSEMRESRRNFNSIVVQSETTERKLQERLEKYRADLRKMDCAEKDLAKKVDEMTKCYYLVKAQLVEKDASNRQLLRHVEEQKTNVDLLTTQCLDLKQQQVTANNSWNEKLKEITATSVLESNCLRENEIESQAHNVVCKTLQNIQDSLLEHVDKQRNEMENKQIALLKSHAEASAKQNAELMSKTTTSEEETLLLSLKRKENELHSNVRLLRRAEQQVSTLSLQVRQIKEEKQYLEDELLTAQLNLNETSSKKKGLTQKLKDSERKLDQCSRSSETLQKKIQDKTEEVARLLKLIESQNARLKEQQKLGLNQVEANIRKSKELNKKVVKVKQENSKHRLLVKKQRKELKASIDLIKALERMLYNQQNGKENNNRNILLLE